MRTETREGRRAGRRTVVFAVGAFAALSALAPATTVVELDFLELHRRAGRLVHGRCLSRVEVPDADPIPYTEYTFEVLEAVKGGKDARGAVIEKLTFRHAGTRSGHVRADGLEVLPLRLGLPEYDVGDEMVLFLTAESSLGLCAPVGLNQGAFPVRRDGGKATVRYPVGRKALLDGVERESFDGLGKGALKAIRDPGDTIELDAFLDLCRRAKP